MSTFSAVQALPKPRLSTPTNRVDYFVTQRPKGDGAEALVSNFPNRFAETETSIVDLLTDPGDWDDHETPRPLFASVERARSWATELYRDLSAGLWIKPHISVDEGGEVSFEWWKGRKKLSILITPAAIEYVTVEKIGPSVQMTDGAVETSDKRRQLWKWLIS